MPFRFYLLSGISVWQSFCLFPNACRAWRASIFLPLSFLFFRRCKIRNYPRHWKNFLRCFSLKMPFYWYTSIMCAHTMRFSAFWLHCHHIRLWFILSILLVACNLFTRCYCKRQALRQIEDKGYAMPYDADLRRLYKIGVNFSSERRCIEEWKIVEGWTPSPLSMKLTRWDMTFFVLPPRIWIIYKLLYIRMLHLIFLL